MYFWISLAIVLFAISPSLAFAFGAQPYRGGWHAIPYLIWWTAPAGILAQIVFTVYWMIRE